MANDLYSNARNAFLTGQLDWTTAAIKVVLVDTGQYTVDLANHVHLSDIPAAARVSTTTLTGKSASGGIADAADATFTAVSGNSVEAVVIYEDTGTETTSQLIAYIDSGGGLPITPNGSDILLQWSDSTNRVFKL